VLALLHVQRRTDAAALSERVESAFRIGRSAPSARKLVLERITR